MDISIGVTIVGLLIFLVLLGMPVALSLLTSSFIGIAILRSPELAGRFLAAAANDALNDYLYGVIPLFVLMGLVVCQSGIGRDTFDVFEWMLRRIRGGLGIATVAANMVFAAITGVSIASAAVFSRIAVPEMRRHGYSAELAVGAVAGSSVLGMLIPPSLLLIVYGVIAEQSVGKLFVAGLLPGLLLALIFAGIIVLIAYWRPKNVGINAAVEAGQVSPDTHQGRNLTRRQAVGLLLPIFLLIMLVLGGIYSGLFSPTEAGAVGAAGAILIAVLRRTLSGRDFWQVLMETGNINVSILFLIIAAMLYSRVLTLSGLPGDVAEMIAAMQLGYVQFMLLYVAILVVMGCFIDSVSILLIVVPIVLPVAKTMGLDPIWFGVVSIIAIEIGLLTPPFGMSAFVVKASLHDQGISLATVFRGAVPFIGGMLLLIVLLTLFPQIALLLV
ncbi:TRAP transporter large permease [Phaeovulum sp. W22_SRMD_FR3]|uniref:TRAP transporter large permease n=1 Tax=Phaeovulum sp. W22_SRMD_FR3 TaxID=3240274 RepID=UPI003F9E5607